MGQSKKDYIKIAQIIGQFANDIEMSNGNFQLLIDMMSANFKQDNIRFSTEKFNEECWKIKDIYKRG